MTNYLRTYRKKAGFSQKEVAFLLGQASHGEVARHENSIRYPNLTTILAYESIYGLLSSVSLLYPGLYLEICEKVKQRAQVLIGNLMNGRDNLRKIDALKKIIAGEPNLHGQTILSLDPTIRGFGYAVMKDNPLTLLDWSAVDCRGGKWQNCLEKVIELIDNYQPKMIVLPDPNDKEVRRGQGARAFMMNLLTLARKSKIKTKTLKREEVKRFFLQYGAATKLEIAQFLAQRFPELQPRLPEPRGPGEPENYQMSIFVAVGFAITALHPCGA